MIDFKGKNYLLFNDDCLKVLKELPDASVDLVIIDPPYNIGKKDKLTKKGNKIMSNKDAWGEWDNYEVEFYRNWLTKVYEECFRILKGGRSLYSFTARKDNSFFINVCEKIGFTYRNSLAMIKNNPLPSFNKNNFRSAFELCFYVSKGKPKTFNFLSQRICSNVFSYNNTLRETIHPTEKPLHFIENIVRISSNEGDVVLDCFLGSGTTGVASVKFGRRFIGVEKDKGFFDVCYERMKGVDCQSKLF